MIWLYYCGKDCDNKILWTCGLAFSFFFPIGILLERKNFQGQSLTLFCYMGQGGGLLYGSVGGSLSHVCSGIGKLLVIGVVCSFCIKPTTCTENYTRPLEMHFGTWR